MAKSKQEKIDTLIAHLECMFDIKHQINKETDYCNHSYVIKTLLPGYEASKRLVSESVKELLDINSEE